jgi:hypothetical protein
MHVYAAAARFRQGVVLGGNAGDSLREVAIAVFAEQGVLRPLKLIDALAPGQGGAP